MKKLMLVALASLLVAAGAVPGASAAKKKPVKTTLFMHGPSVLGEADGAQWVADGAGTPTTTLTPEEPAAGPPKSMTYFNPLLNDQCSGLPLAFPTFQGPLKGTIVGDVTMDLHLLAAPSAAPIKARIWTDTPVFSCNDSYVPPAAEVDVEVPPGHNVVKVVFPKLKLKAQMNVMVEILALSGTDYRGQVGRLLYDSESTASSITFNCIPASGTSCA